MSTEYNKKSYLGKFDFLKDIGINTQNIPDEIKNIYNKIQKLSVNEELIKEAELISQLTVKDLILLQAAERDNTCNFYGNKDFTNGLAYEKFNNKIRILIDFLNLV